MFERIREQVKKIKENTDISAEDKKGVLKVVEYLLTRNDMDEKYNNPEKSLMEMWKFIKDEAKEKAINGVAVMDDDEVYSIAIHYFDESNEKLKIKSKITKVSAKETDDTKENKVLKQQEEISSSPEADNENATVENKNDDEIVMVFKGQPITYKQFKEGTYLTR